MRVFAISYDPVDVLAAFAEQRGIAYTLLSDAGSRVIERLGLLNRHVEEQHGFYGVKVQPHHYGIAYPGTFLLDENGVVVDKRFEQSYRVRPTGATLVEASLGAVSTRPGVSTRAETEELRVTASIGQTTYRIYQQLRLNLELQVAPGLHVYGQPIPEGYAPLTVEIDPLESLEVGPLELPAPRPFKVEGLDERFVIYEGAFRGALPFRLLQNLGDVEMVVRIGYQACSDLACFMPDELTLRLPLQGLDLVRD